MLNKFLLISSLVFIFINNSFVDENMCKIISSDKFQNISQLIYNNNTNEFEYRTKKRLNNFFSKRWKSKRFMI